MSLVAILEGTWLRPELRFAFGWGANLNGVAAQTWVKNLPGRRWDKEQGCWFITGTGGHPDRAFAARGIAVDFSQAEGDLSGLTELEPLWRPEVRYSRKFPDHAFVYPRLAGFEKVSGILGPGAVWEKARQRFQVRLTDLIDAEGNPKRGLQSADRAIEPAIKLRAARELPVEVAESARYLASTTGFDPEDGDNPVLSKTAKHHIDIVSRHTGRLPEWFGLALYPFQECGAYAAAAGFNMLCDEPGLGKGGTVDSKILTPTGWKTYGEIKVGDHVIGSNGRATTVTGVYFRGELDVYRVTMSDGSSVLVDGDHLWPVATRDELARGAFQVRSTADLRRGGMGDPCGSKRNGNFIPMVKPIEFERHNAPLPIAPYVLGALLGGGYFGRVIQLLTSDQWIADKVESLLPTGHVFSLDYDSASSHKEGRERTLTLSAKPGRTNRIPQLVQKLGLAGAKSSSRFIPEPYLLASAADRLELLRGILDTKGSAIHEPLFSTLSSQLADGVQFIVESLGGHVSRADRLTSSSGQDAHQAEARPIHLLSITMPTGLYPFTTPNKTSLASSPALPVPERAITSIEPAGRAEVVCISVAAKDQLYVTEHCIVTHNTRSALAAAAITGAKRVLVLCPPLVLTNWAREASTALGPGIRARRRSGPRMKPQPQAVRRPGKRTPKQPDPYGTVIVRPGRKVPEFPDEGVLIVAYSLITARPELLDQVVQWGADAVLVDESHYLRTWTSGRGSVVRRLAATIDGLRLPMTGTPMLSNPAELANQMAISGHLDPVFGGASNYLERFTREDPFGGRKPVKRELKHLRAVMDGEVWTRRNKGDVLLSLPGKLRAVRMVEVDNRAFEKAHDELYEKLELWVDEHRAEHGNSPDEETVRAYARSNVGLLSPLRRAAGMSKVPAAIEIITDWMEQTTSFDAAGDPVYERPLVVWAHHHEVLAALRDAIPEGMSAAVIDGSTTSDERARLADEFQAGRIGVLICSIIAAGFGITLTRGSDAIFVETDWTPAHISQAEDRNNRIGQVSRVTATTLVAPETLDLQVRAVLRNKAETLNEVVVGADNNVAQSDLTQGSDGAMWETTPEEEALAAELPDKHAIIVRIVEDILRERDKKPVRGKKKIAV